MCEIGSRTTVLLCCTYDSLVSMVTPHTLSPFITNCYCIISYISLPNDVGQTISFSSAAVPNAQRTVLAAKAFAGMSASTVLCQLDFPSCISPKTAVFIVTHCRDEGGCARA